MKANRRFREGDDAVSPVIAVILMVAITVVLAATIYVWVSGFSGGGQAKNLSAVVSDTSGGVASISIVSVSPNFNWANLKVVVDGASGYGIVAQGVYVKDTAWTSSASGAIGPGDIIKIAHRDASASTVKVNFVDVEARAVVSSITANIGNDGTAPTVTATKADPTVVTFSEAMYSTDTTLTTATDFFGFVDDGTADGDAIDAAGTLTYSNGFTSINVEMDNTPAAPAPEAGDDLTAAGTQNFFDLAGNAWSASYAYT